LGAIKKKMGLCGGLEEKYGPVWASVGASKVKNCPVWGHKGNARADFWFQAVVVVNYSLIIFRKYISLERYLPRCSPPMQRL
jgi:hypothetical protein